MTDAREIDGFCTDCGNWTDLRGPIGDRRCRCGSGRVAVPPTGFRIIGPDEVDQVTVEKCASIADADGRRELSWAEMSLPVSPGPVIAKDRAAVSDRIASAIRAIGRKA